MLPLTRTGILNEQRWEQAGIQLPKFDIAAMETETEQNPQWIHFGAGNIFRGFIAELQQQLLNTGRVKTGIIAVDTYDYEIIDRIYRPHDNLCLLVLMKPDGTLDKKVVAGIARGLRGSFDFTQDWDLLTRVFTNPSLQMASFTITEKGYSLRDLAGDLLPVVQQDMENGPERPKHAMAIAASLAYRRFSAGEFPLAFVSMDNCSQNGQKLFSAVLEIARAWEKNRFVPASFLNYLQNPDKITFPWSMIDKITPRPSDFVRETLEKDGVSDMAPITTDKNTFIAPFVNAEVPQYLVVEDLFPNGRPPLENAGVYFTDRATVEKTERMKVTTCLNPLHTALAVYGCLLGYDSIAAEMKDPQLKKLVEQIGYEEGMPVVVHPGILNPEDFIHQVVNERLPNPFIPDTPQRIATDTSQKIPIRFGETIKAYQNRPDLDAASLTCIPLALAGWCRYLLGINDQGEPMLVSSDPMLEQLQIQLGGICLGENFDSKQLRPVLSNSVLFGVNLYEVGLGEKVEGFFREMTAGKHAVRDTLKKYLKE